MSDFLSEILSYFVRYASDAYGQQTLVGANWNLFWWFVAAGFAFVVAHAISVPLMERRQARVLDRAGKK